MHSASRVRLYHHHDIHLDTLGHDDVVMTTYSSTEREGFAVAALDGIGIAVDNGVRVPRTGRELGVTVVVSTGSLLLRC